MREIVTLLALAFVLSSCGPPPEDERAAHTMTATDLHAACAAIRVLVPTGFEPAVVAHGAICESPASNR